MNIYKLILNNNKLIVKLILINAKLKLIEFQWEELLPLPI